MAIWKEPATQKRDEPAFAPEPVARKDADLRVESTPAAYSPPARHVADRDTKESLLSAGLTIEGKIEGSGHIRIAGRFNGDVNVRGNLSIEPGAKLVGAVSAETVTVGGELEGNISSASRVELLESGVLTGDLKAGSLTVAAGSRMRGKVEFGWSDDAPRKSTLNLESGSVS
ncbi:MAG TPA: polymer-forming cytoskeletal protein [Gemmatimonadaceae bacterium]